MTQLVMTVQTDCESTQSSIADPDLGERAIRGLGDILADHGLLGTFVVIPGDLQVHGHLYRELAAAGHEIGLHLHPAELGYDEFMGVYGQDEQADMLQQGITVFADVMGKPPKVFTPGYCSANDATFPVLEALGFTHGTVSMPTRNLPQCACIWGNSPLDMHYPHRHNRSLTGNVDFVDIPLTIDPDSRLWGGAHPQDLRVELVDAKNHYYTMDKAVRRQLAGQLAGQVPVPYLKALTHNIFDYAAPDNFRRETLVGIIAAAKRIADDHDCELIAGTSADLAESYRAAVPLPSGGQRLTLDTRGRN